MDLEAWKSKWTRQDEARWQSGPDILGEARARESTETIRRDRLRDNPKEGLPF